MKGNSFYWTNTTHEVFEKLKEVMITTLILALPNFSKRFLIEIDVSGEGIGVVLMQEEHHITYISKSLSP